MTATKKDLQELLEVTADAAEELGYTDLASDLRAVMSGAHVELARTAQGPRVVPLYQAMASTLQALANTERVHNSEWVTGHSQHLQTLMDRHLPHGSGFDADVTLDVNRSTPEHLVIVAPFHEMDQNGFYRGWRDVEVHVRPSLVFDLDLRIVRAGRDLGDYIHEVFDEALRRLVDPYA